MDIGDSGEFTRRLVAIGELFDATLSPAKQALYFEALRDLEFPDVARALNAAARACTFMPKPAELRRLVVGDDEDRAERAWLLFREAMKQFGAYVSIAMTDAALAHTIVAMFGGWTEACVAEFTPEMWTAKRKEFGRIYRVFCDRNIPGPRYLPGLVEKQNGDRLDWQKYTSVALLDGMTCRQLELHELDAYRVVVDAKPVDMRHITEGESIQRHGASA